MNAQQDETTAFPVVEALRRRKQPKKAEEGEEGEAKEPSGEGESPETSPDAAELVEQTYRHPDERQVQLDTDRSFVMYPYSVGDTLSSPTFNPSPNTSPFNHHPIQRTSHRQSKRKKPY